MRNDRPVIGILGSHEGGELRIPTRYLNALWQGGALGVTLPYTTDRERIQEYVNSCDGFLYSGGVDVDPARYGESKQSDSVEIDGERDDFEFAMFPAVYDSGKPILGICRGIQLMNVALGGDLYQDIKPFEHVPHNDHWGKIHTVTVRRDTLLSRILGQDTVLVNSQHHQAVDKVAPGLVLSALSEDGIVEGIEKPDAKFCLGVQWHPEWLSAADPAMQGIFDAFVAACK